MRSLVTFYSLILVLRGSNVCGHSFKVPNFASFVKWKLINQRTVHIV